MIRPLPNENVVELTTLAESFEHGGICITARCFKIDNSKPRYEIYMRSGDLIGVVDVPGHEKEPALRMRVQQSLRSFAESIRIKRLP